MRRVFVLLGCWLLVGFDVDSSASANRPWPCHARVYERLLHINAHRARAGVASSYPDSDWPSIQHKLGGYSEVTSRFVK
jgi:hypothetical protein